MTAFMRLCILFATITTMVVIVVVGSLSAPTAADAHVQASNPPVDTSTRVVQTVPHVKQQVPANATGFADVVMGSPLPAGMTPPTPTPLPTLRRAVVGPADAVAGTTRETGQLDRWTVGKHETLSEISLKALGSARRWHEIALLNPSVDPDRMTVGTVLKLPVDTPVSSGTARSAETVSSQPETVRGQRTYQVQDGDSLSSIAARLLGSPNDWQRIFEANRAIMKNDPDRLSTGMTLVIPAR